MCKVIKEKKKKEAIKRMAKLGMFKPCIKAFEKYDELQLTEPTGILYEFSDNEELNALLTTIKNQGMEIEALNAELEKIKGVTVLAEDVKPKKAPAKKAPAKKAKKAE